MITSRYIRSEEVDWDFNYYIVTFFISLINIVIIYIYAALITNKGNILLKKGQKKLNEYYSVD
jgi:hypothetical protein